MGTKNPFAWGISIRHTNDTLVNVGLSCCSEYQDTAVLSYSKDSNVCKNVDKKRNVPCIKKYPTQYPWILTYNVIEVGIKTDHTNRHMLTLVLNILKTEVVYSCTVTSVVLIKELK
jgi:hypothetical protein